MNFLFVTSLGLLIFVINCQMNYVKRIIGGQEAPSDKYRWAVSIKGDIDELKGSGVCGATILKTEGEIRWLMTAAHCFFVKSGAKRYNLTDPKLWHARIGLLKVDYNYKKHGLKFKIHKKLKEFFRKAYKALVNRNGSTVINSDIHIKKVIIHPRYEPNRVEYDIALMKLEVALPVDELKGVSSIDLPDISLNREWPPIESECVVVGWGCTEHKKHPSTYAKLAFLKVWENEECEEAFGAPIDLNPNHEFCAGYLKKRYGLCKGDSGSGLACLHNNKWTLAGVVSAVHTLLPASFPALFTRVTWFNEWIRDTVKNN